MNTAQRQGTKTISQRFRSLKKSPPPPRMRMANSKPHQILRSNAVVKTGAPVLRFWLLKRKTTSWILHDITVYIYIYYDTWSHSRLRIYSQYRSYEWDVYHKKSCRISPEEHETETKFSHMRTMVLEYESQHLPHQWPSHVGKYTSTMEHMGLDNQDRDG